MCQDNKTSVWPASTTKLSDKAHPHSPKYKWNNNNKK